MKGRDLRIYAWRKDKKEAVKSIVYIKITQSLWHYLDYESLQDYFQANSILYK